MITSEVKGFILKITRKAYITSDNHVGAQWMAGRLLQHVAILADRQAHLWQGTLLIIVIVVFMLLGVTQELLV